MKRLHQEPRLAVVVPTLNEAAGLAKTLDAVLSQGDDTTPVLVADGGSTDGTQAIAKRCGANVFVSPRRGRGCQIAAGVSQLQEEIILIVHADMILQAGALNRVRKWLAEHPACPGGCLGHRFDSPKRFFRLVEWWDRRRAKVGVSYGDQAQFFRRDLLEREGGFPDQPIMEDVELCRRLRRLGPIVYLDYPVVVSARRFMLLGCWSTVFVNLALRLVYRCCGLRASRAIYRYYYRNSAS